MLEIILKGNIALLNPQKLHFIWLGHQLPFKYLQNIVTFTRKTCSTTLIYIINITLLKNTRIDPAFLPLIFCTHTFKILFHTAQTVLQCKDKLCTEEK
jgi:hypothetical protein